MIAACLVGTLFIAICSLVAGCAYLMGQRRERLNWRTTFPSSPSFERPANAKFGRLTTARTFGVAHRVESVHG